MCPLYYTSNSTILFLTLFCQFMDKGTKGKMLVTDNLTLAKHCPFVRQENKIIFHITKKSLYAITNMNNM